MTRKKKKQKRKLTLVDYSERTSDVHKNAAVKSLIDFDHEYSSSIKAVAIKQSANAKVTTRFLRGKMLMFAKVSIKRFAYDLIDVFMFPDQRTKEIYQKYNIEKSYVYQNLTDTDSTSLFFLFICNLKSSVDKSKAREIIFEVMVKSKILNRLDLSDDFWQQFSVQNRKLKKLVGPFEVENINKTNVVTIALNPKEYYEEFDDYTNNKKHKGLKKSTPDMDFEAYCGRLADLHEYCDEFFQKPKENEQKKISNNRRINANERG